MKTVWNWKVTLSTVFALLSLSFVGCTEGSYDDPDVQIAAPPPGGGSGGGDASLGCAGFFSQNIQPELGYCRSCHVPGGVADVEEGEDIQFTDNPDEDLSRMYAGWEQLGGNNPTSRILTMASGTDAESHSGGEPWPVGGQVYTDVETLLQGFESGWCNDALNLR